MTIKELAYSAQKQLETGTNQHFKRTHIYELLAAAFGYSSYAALVAEAVFTEKAFTSRRLSAKSPLVHSRCVELAYPVDIAKLVAASLPEFLAQREIGIIRVADLVATLQSDSYVLDDDEDESLEREGEGWDASDDRWVNLRILASPILLDGLETAAQGGKALAHYALALIHAPDEYGDDPEVGADYWYQRAKAGWVLSGVEKEWADAHALTLSKAEKYERHLREAARLGLPVAMLAVANQFGDPAFFEQGVEEVDADPAMVAEIAERLSRPQDARKWLTVAATSGDVEAMRQLIEDYDQDDLLQCWTWVHLARLVGTDLTADAYRAIHEDGSDYDDDVGGPMYADGRDGVALDALSQEMDAVARRQAHEIFVRINAS